MGRVLGLSPANMTKMRQQGCPMESVKTIQAWREARQRIDRRKPLPIKVVTKTEASAESLAARVAFNKLKAEGDALPHNDFEESLDSARTRLMTADANLAEIKLSDLRGKYLERTKVDSTAFEIARALRDSLMNCARRIAADVAGISSADECETVIEREHRALLENMTHSLINKLGAPQ